MTQIIQPYTLVVQTQLGQEFLPFTSKEEAEEKAMVATRQGLLRFENEEGAVAIIMVGPGTKFIVMSTQALQRQINMAQQAQMLQDFNKSNLSAR